MRSIVSAYILLSLVLWGLSPAAWSGSPELYDALASAAGRFVLSELGLGEQMIGRGASMYAGSRIAEQDPVETVFERVRLRFLAEHPESEQVFRGAKRIPTRLEPSEQQALKSLAQEELRIFLSENSDYTTLSRRFVTESDQEAWVAQSRFLPADNQQVLSLVRDEALSAVASGRKPAVVFDLDETGIENRSSAAALLLGKGGWVESTSSAAFPRARAALKRIPLGRMKVGVPDIFREAGISDESAAMRSVQKFFDERTFTDRNVALYGSAFPGFVDYVKSLHRSGVHVFYLTGRRGEVQGAGTRATIGLLGLPLDSDATLLMKPSQVSTADFKTEALRKIRDQNQHEVLAMFDNEPGNLLTAQAAFPNLKLVFMDTQFFHVPSRPASGLYRISHW